MGSKNEKLLTLCTAAYNAEKCITAMFQSVAETHRQEEIELLVVNDGSKDHTEEIILKYREQYPDMIRYISKENGGAGSAWNIGIQEASGEYFKLLDADDFVDSNGLKKLLDVLKTEKSDLILTNYTKVYPNRMTLINFKNVIHPAVGEDVAYIKRLKFTMHAAVFRTEILRKHGMKLTERVPYTDFQYIMFPIPFVKTVSYYDINVYMYNLGVEGQSVSAEVMLRHLDKLVKVIEVVVDYYVEYEKKGWINQSQQSIMIKSILSQYRDVIKLYLRHEKNDKITKIKLFDEKVGLADEMMKNASGKYGAVKIIRMSNYKLCSVVAVWYQLKYKLYRILKER